MIWLITLFLIAVICYLTMQGLAERRLLEETDGEPNEDADLFMTVSNSLNPEAFDGDVAVADDDSRFAKAVQNIQQKSTKASVALERKVSELSRDPKASLFDRSMSRISAVSENADQKLEKKIAAARAEPVGTTIEEEDSHFGRMVTKVNDTLKKSEEKMQSRTDRFTQDGAGKLSEESGFFAKAVNRVSSSLESIDKRVDEKLAASTKENTDDIALSSNEDFFSRVAGKVGEQVNKTDDKIVDASRKMTGRADS